MNKNRRKFLELASSLSRGVIKLLWMEPFLVASHHLLSKDTCDYQTTLGRNSLDYPSVSRTGPTCASAISPVGGELAL